MLSGPNLAKRARLLSFKRTQSRVVIDLLTGHNTLRRHWYVLGLSDNLICRKCDRLQLKCDGTRWGKGGEVKGKLANGLGTHYFSHYLGTWCIQHYYRWCAQLGCQQSTWTDAPADLHGLVRFAERRNLISAGVPAHFNWPLLRRKPQFTFYVSMRPWLHSDTHIQAPSWIMRILGNWYRGRLEIC